MQEYLFFYQEKKHVRTLPPLLFVPHIHQVIKHFYDCWNITSLHTQLECRSRLRFSSSREISRVVNRTVAVHFSRVKKKFSKSHPVSLSAGFEKSENCAVTLCHLFFLCTLAAPDFGPVDGVSRCGPYKSTTNSAATVANFEDKKMTSAGLGTSASNCTALLNRIKERLLMMDLINQMDKAKELTQFVLTHQAIPREDKE